MTLSVSKADARQGSYCVQVPPSPSRPISIPSLAAFCTRAHSLLQRVGLAQTYRVWPCALQEWGLLQSGRKSDLWQRISDQVTPVHARCPVARSVKAEVLELNNAYIT